MDDRKEDEMTRTAKTGFSYCSANHCEKARECARHKSHWRFDEKLSARYSWVDFEICQGRMIGFFVPKDKR